MSHECPECGVTCRCGGDLDDYCFSGTRYEMQCTHCDIWAYDPEEGEQE